MRFPSTALLASTLLAISAKARFVIYADEWHPTRPTNPRDRAGIDHVILAFAPANATATFQPKVPIHTIRTEFPNAKVMIAVGGWGDTVGFCQATKSDASMLAFAADVATMLARTGADGVEDIDWEYPGGNGADYKQVANWDQTYQIAAFPKLLAAIRAAIGKKLLSIAVPGKEGQSSYTCLKQIWPSVDFINVMSYDLMNRRDTVTKHHSSVVDAENSIKDYLAMGAPPSKLNLGFAYYAKYFTTQGDCSGSPLNCLIVLAEDAQGKDTLTSGAWTFERSRMRPVDASSLIVSQDGTCGPEKRTKCETGCCSQHGHCGTSPEHCNGACQHAFGTGCTDADVAASWQLAAKYGVTDEVAGGQYYFDATNRLFWTWDTPELITRKFDNIVRKYKLGGVMAWSLGEDSADWSHIRHMAKEVAKVGLGSATANDSNEPVDDYMYDEIADYCCPNGYDPANSMSNEDGLVEMQYTTDALQAMPTKHDQAALETPRPHVGVMTECLGEGGATTWCPLHYTNDLPSMPTETSPAAIETSWPTDAIIIECMGENGGLTWCPQSYTDEALSSMNSVANTLAD
ncbi:hypothetical protein J4E89_004694 [Alternaria sp. Ai002NY15]|nr:hypothetical protein J4E89_004694 [Alternaria sp. Ai002NY15]